MKLFLDISFLGSNYCGYQVQPNKSTVQGELNSATKQLFGYDCDIVGCSRTDSGVHANHFCLTVAKKGRGSIVTSISENKLASAVDVRLPSDISVNFAKLVDDSFHARYDVKSKEYMYLILNSRSRSPFLHDRAWHYSRYIDDATLEQMNIAASHFVGKHDFRSYMAANAGVTDTVRTIINAKVERSGDMVIFRVSADGFLYNMVRILTGTLVSVAEGKISADDIRQITEARDRSRAGVTAPPHGLYLNKIIY